MSSSVPRRLAPLLPGAALFALLAWQLNLLCDDAYISFRYGRNLVEGHGLVFNLHGEEPVEGYTNFLWVLWIALFQGLGFEPGLPAQLSSAACGLALVLWVPVHARKRLELDPFGTAAVGLFLGSLPAFALWTTGGLATMPTALCLFGTYERLLGDPERPRPGQAGLFAALTSLLRADGLLWVGLVLAAGGVHWLRGGRGRTLGRGLLVTAAIACAVVAVHVGWRISYYGDYLPHTARVKVGLSAYRLQRGFDYLMTWWLVMPGTWLVMLASLASLRRSDASLLLPAWVVLVGAQLYAVWVGGDFMPFGRFLFSAVPFLALLFAQAWGRWARAGRAPLLLPGLPALALVLLGGLACYGVDLFPASLRSRFHFRMNNEWKSELRAVRFMRNNTRQWKRLGQALALFTEPGESIVLTGIGAIGYYSRLEVHDCYGLVSPEVAEAVEPVQEASPGHDLQVSIDFFLKQRPNLLGAFFAPVEAPRETGLPPGWFDHPVSKAVRIERHPLPPNQGFEEGQELRLMRFLPGRRPGG